MEDLLHLNADPLKSGVNNALGVPNLPDLLQPPQQQPSPAAGPLGPEPTEEEVPTAEEQKLYDQLTTRAREYIHGENSREKIVESLKPIGDERPESAIGRVTATVMSGVIDTAKRGGQKIYPDAAMEAGKDITSDVTEIAVAARVAPDDPDLQSKAFMEAVRLYGNKMIQSGNPYQEEAANFMASQVAGEVDRGEVPPGQLSQAGALPPLKEPMA